MAIRLMLADDHRRLREGLRRSMTDAGFDVIGEACDGVEAVSLADQLHPDVILMDVTMPNCDGVEACRQLKQIGTDSRIVMLTMPAYQEVLTNAIRAGAVGYLTKDCSTREIAEAVRMAAEVPRLAPDRWWHPLRDQRFHVVPASGRRPGQPAPPHAGHRRRALDHGLPDHHRCARPRRHSRRERRGPSIGTKTVIRS